jgi:DNA-binding ferritin-like protein
MIRRHLMCAREAKSLAEVADMAGDEISGHIAVQRQSVHERSAWILTALIESKPTRSVM